MKAIRVNTFCWLRSAACSTLSQSSVDVVRLYEGMLGYGYSFAERDVGVAVACEI